MSIIKWVALIYCLISLSSLFNKGIRHLYLGVLDDLYSRFFSRLDKKHFRVKTRDYFYALLYCLGDLLHILLNFIFAPIIILYHLPTGGYQYTYSHTPYWKTKPSEPIKSEYLKSPLIVKLKKEIPFIPDKKQIVYLENSINEPLNNYLSREYQNICNLFREKGFDFVFIPKLTEIIGIEEAKYLNPTLNNNNHTPNTLVSQDIYNRLLSFVDIPTSLTGGLLRYKEENEDYYIFTYYQFSNLQNTEIWEQIRAYLSAVGDVYKLYSLASPSQPYIDNPDDNADYEFDSESKKLIEEIKERVEALKQKGINEMVLKSIFSIDSVKLSRLVITNEYKIFLPDYNNLEISIYPLPKAIFFLFLNYPEGIIFKDLPDYRDELIAIYKKVSGRENLEEMEKTINDVVNPTLNSINEQCSRIRGAFIKHFDESIAKNYFITGDRANPKKIALDRSLVVLEEVEIKLDVAKTPFEYVKHKNKYNQAPEMDSDDSPF